MRSCIKLLLFIILFTSMIACDMGSQKKVFNGSLGEVELIVLNPGHFHAALLQRSMQKSLNHNVHIYAPEGVELKSYLNLIESYNNQEHNSTHWNLNTYIGNDYLEKMLSDKEGNVVVLAGNNKLKSDYILKSVENGLNVLADKPMAIDKDSFDKLKRAFSLSAKNKVFLYDIMTERYGLINILNKELMQDEDFFGHITSGTPENPAVELESVHHFFKVVSGSSLTRPAWYYDVEQQGEGIVDVTTHLVDLVNWKCFPEKILNYETDVKLIDASHWTTSLSFEQFKKSTREEEYPSYLKKYVKDSVLHVYANGKINYQVKDINVSIKVIWNYEPPQGMGDTHKTIIKGTKATLFILQGEEQNYVPKFYVKKNMNISDAEFKTNLEKIVTKLSLNYSITLKEAYNGMIELEINTNMDRGHETHFSKVAEKYFNFLVAGEMPDWEIPNMLAKYYITTSALEIAKAKDK